MFCKRHRIPLLTTIFLALSLLGCARSPAGVPQRLAVLPFENLSSNLDLDWMRRGASAALASDLTGLPDLYAATVGSSSEAYAMQASRALGAYFCVSKARLEIHATITGLDSAKSIQSFEIDGPFSEGMLPLVDRLAKRVNPAARAFGTVKPEAFRDYAEALGGADQSTTLRILQSATVADPHFAAAYVGWARLLFSGGQRAEALKVIEAGLGNEPGPIERGELDYLRASTTGDVREREKALEALTRVTPADSKVFRELASVEMSQRKFQESVRYYEAAIKLNPDEPQAWNEMGYALAAAGDLAGARKAIEHYQQIGSSDEANALDSLGEVSYYLGDFAGAAKYFLAADEKTRGQFGGGELLKAAQARLMAGDLRDADAIFQKHIAQIQGAQRARAAYQVTEWQFLTGRHKAAMNGLEGLLPSLDADAQSQALCQLSVWKLATGDFKGAADLATQSAARAMSPRARNLSALCRVISNPPEGSSGSRLADAYSLLFARKFREAAVLLEGFYRETNPAADGQIRTLLAWAYVEVGRIAEARPLLRSYPIPLASGEPTFASLVFPRYMFLRGVVLERDGKRAEAKQSYELFLKYAGDVPEIFGDVEKARKTGVGG